MRPPVGLLYFSIGFLTAVTTNQIVLLAINEPAMADTMNWFQWLFIIMQGILGGLIPLKAMGSNQRTEEKKHEEISDNPTVPPV